MEETKSYLTLSEETLVEPMIEQLFDVYYLFIHLLTFIHLLNVYCRNLPLNLLVLLPESSWLRLLGSALAALSQLKNISPLFCAFIVALFAP